MSIVNEVNERDAKRQFANDAAFAIACLALLLVLIAGGVA